MGTETIREVRLNDAARICEIYNHYVINTAISFEEEAVSKEEMSRRISAITREYPWIAVERAGETVGYAYASRWKERSAYRFVAETTVYVSPDHLGEGLGSALMLELIRRLARLDLRSLMAVIALPNEKSVALHEKLGFKKTAHFSEVGFKFGRWIDVGYWQKTLIRRGTGSGAALC